MVSVFEVDLFFQASIFAVLAVGMLFERKHKTQLHAQLMLSAVVLNIVSFLAVMGPALHSVREGVSGPLGFVAVGHVSLGGLAFLLSFWVVGSWLVSPLLAQPLKIRCYGSFNKKVMWAIMISWLASLLLGFFLYAMLKTGYLGSFPVSGGG